MNIDDNLQVATTCDKALWRAVQLLDDFICYNIKMSLKKFQCGEVLVFGGNILDTSSGSLVTLPENSKLQAIKKCLHQSKKNMLKFC